MLNWIYPQEKCFKSDNKEPCGDSHFPSIVWYVVKNQAFEEFLLYPNKRYVVG